jgi:hypothetical protein
MRLTTRTSFDLGGRRPEGGVWFSRWGPLNQEVGEGLALDCVAWLKVKVKLRELYSPLDHSPGTLSVTQYLAKRIGHHHRDLMRLKIMTQLPRRHQNCIQHLLGLRVIGLGVSQRLANEVDRPLHLSAGLGLFTRGTGLGRLGARVVLIGPPNICVSGLGVRGRRAAPPLGALGAFLRVSGIRRLLTRG